MLCLEEEKEGMIINIKIDVILHWVDTISLQSKSETNTSGQNTLGVDLNEKSVSVKKTI